MAVAQEPVAQRVIPAFPPWLDLPPGYIVNDWIAWQKGKLVATKLRFSPQLIQVARERLEARGSDLYQAQDEWLQVLREKPVEDVARILESPDPEGQRMRSSSPFTRPPFVEPAELDAILERAYAG